MDPRTRMFKTLVCLVGSMTGTAALLAWMDPSAPLTAEAPPFEVLLGEARSLVTDDVVVLEDRWDDVEILAGPGRTASASFLTARADIGGAPRNSEHHFHVDLKGRASRTPRWSRQEGSTDGKRTVSIRVMPADPDQPMSRVQWNSVRALITALSKATGRRVALRRSDLDDRQDQSRPAGLSTPALTVRLEEPWARVYGLEPGTVLEIAGRPVEPVSTGDSTD